MSNYITRSFRNMVLMFVVVVVAAFFMRNYSPGGRLLDRELHGLNDSPDEFSFKMQVAKPCESEMFRFCATTHSAAQLNACLLKNKTLLSPTCLQAISATHLTDEAK